MDIGEKIVNTAMTKLYPTFVPVEWASVKDVERAFREY